MTDEEDEVTATSDGGSGDLEAVCAAVGEQIHPDETERAELRRVADTLIERATTAVRERCPDADVLQAGSTARGTWISGDRDIDIFVRFPPETDRETLERDGLAVGHATLPDGYEAYAEHPYVKGEYEGFDVDIVPCFRLESATEIQSAVDRTPFHTQYLEARLTDELTRDVRLTKQFTKAIGVYGSNLKTEGFSGYLTELLVLEYGGFRPLCAAATDWQPPIELDPEDHADAQFSDPLVLIDPTDPERNVAAVCSVANVARFQHYCRRLLEHPRKELFEPPTPEPVSNSEFRTALENRETTPVAIRFSTPDLVDDQLYPQLRKSLEGITYGLQDRGFSVFRADTFVGETGSTVLLIELAVATLPAVERHLGPPVYVRHHADGFYDAYADDPTTYGPFIEGNRYVVEREREFTDAVSFLESDALFTVGLGTHIETALERGYDVLTGDDVLDITSLVGPALRSYLEPQP